MFKLTRRARPAFTLVELIVVISIIFLLIAILLPALAKARGAAKQSICLSNMRQLGIATVGYINDHKTTYPQPGSDGDVKDPVSESKTNTAARAVQDKAVWFNALDPHLSQEKLGYSSAQNHRSYKQDPSWQDLPDADSGGVAQPTVRTIKMNEFFGYITHTADNPNNSARFFREQEIDTPLTKTVLYVDGRAHDTPAINTGALEMGTSGISAFFADEVHAALRHGGAANVAFADGHAGAHKDAVRSLAGASGNIYQGWYIGNASTNGYNGTASGRGDHDLFWRFARNRYP